MGILLPALQDQDFLPGAQLLAQSHSCWFTALWKALPRRAPFLETHPCLLGGTRLSLQPGQEPSALTPSTATINCPRDFQLPLSSHFIPTFCSKEVLGPPHPYQQELKQFSIIPATLKTEISNTIITSPRLLCPMIKSICGSHLLVFTQMRSTKTHGLTGCAHGSCTHQTISANCHWAQEETLQQPHALPETKDPHPL